MSVHGVYIIDAADDRPVQAELDDDLAIDALLDIEDQWSPVREDIRGKLRKLGVATRPESLHWNWGEKSLRLAFSDPNDFRVFALRRKSACEGAMVTRSKNHFAELSPDAGKRGESEIPMAHEKLNINITPEWASAQAKLESDTSSTSVGGLAFQLSGMEHANGLDSQHEAAPAVVSSVSADPKRVSLGKLIELSRRRMRLTVEQLANRANIDLADLYAIEKAEDIGPEPRTIYQLASVLQIRAESLLELAGLITARSSGLTESAIRFAARSEPMDALTKEEEEALNWFVKELSKA